jgi:CheY-like chemotaxis protein/anti-sigma regulatory factor (Ser/Thr protein kinase)
MMRVIRSSAQHLVGMVTNALELARLDSGKVELELNPFEPLACAEDCLDLHAAAAAEKGIELACTVDDAAPWLVGDANRLRQILVNLVGNAVKFTTAGEVLLRISTTSHRDGLCRMQVSVSDTGPGIPRERLESIFQDFTHPDFTIAGRHARSGMGLSISRRLVDMMGGRIWAESTVGEGSTFHLTLVMAKAPAIGGRWRAEPGFAGKRIMIVDENAAVATMLADSLRRWNIEPLVVNDGTAALVSLGRAEPFDAILIDRRIPDRRSLAAAIRQLPGGEALPLVLLTSLGAKGLDESLAGTGGRARFAGYLSKPIKLNRLHEVM